MLAMQQGEAQRLRPFLLSRHTFLAPTYVSLLHCAPSHAPSRTERVSVTSERHKVTTRGEIDLSASGRRAPYDSCNGTRLATRIHGLVIDAGWRMYSPTPRSFWRRKINRSMARDRSGSTFLTVAEIRSRLASVKRQAKESTEAKVFELAIVVRLDFSAKGRISTAMGAPVCEAISNANLKSAARPTFWKV
jgi:hypothetical protein